MDVRYQVFVSSTFVDLEDERRRVIQTLMEMDCIPAGMELFPAADEEQFAFIQKVIDDCDYYLLIVGGRYGSLAPDGISYTEKEYDYALGRGLKVLAFVHESPEELPANKTERAPEGAESFARFTDKVREGRLVRTWKEAAELPGLVALSLTKTIKAFPATGWVRADKTGTPREDLLEELTKLQRENGRLRSELEKTTRQSVPKVENLAGIDELTTLSGSCRYKGGRGYVSDKYVSGTWKAEVTWKQIFEKISPFMTDYLVEDAVGRRIADAFGSNQSRSLHAQVLKTLRLQFVALGLTRVDRLNTQGGGSDDFWKLTEPGKALMYELRLVRTQNPNEPAPP